MIDLAELKKAMDETPDRELLYGIADVFAHVLGAEPDSELAKVLHCNADKVADQASSPLPADRGESR